MSLFASMTASVSGLRTQGEAISVIADNLSNSNTVGYKNARSLFRQMVTSSGVNGSVYNAGGVGSSILRNNNSQGALVATQNSTDLALSGTGFFRVADTGVNSSNTNFFYTRAGSFSENKEGYLVNPGGLYLQGWQTDAVGNIASLQNIRSIELQSVGTSAKATTEMALGANLTSSEIAHTFDTTQGLTATGFNIAAIVATPTTADYTTDLRMYDAQGGARDVTVAYVKRAPNVWDWAVYTDGANIEGGTAGTNTLVDNGTLRFNTNGTLKYARRASATNTNVTFNWSNGVPPATIAMNFGSYTGGSIATPVTNLAFSNHVLDIAVEGTLTGTDFDLTFTGANTLQLRDSANAVLSTVTIPTSSSAQTVVFTTGSTNIRMTVSGPFNEAPGGYPVTIGSFDIANTAGVSSTATGNDGLLQFASAYNTNFINQDGFASGNLSAVAVDKEGFITGTFTNGQTKKLWRVAVTAFQNADGLEPLSNTLFRATDSSGGALLQLPNIAGAAGIVSSSLEQSTVDVANEFSQMIVVQRSYQASSTVISTVDQMLNELMQLR